MYSYTVPLKMVHLVLVLLYIHIVVHVAGTGWDVLSQLQHLSLLYGCLPQTVVYTILWDLKFFMRYVLGLNSQAFYTSSLHTVSDQKLEV